MRRYALLFQNPNSAPHSWDIVGTNLIVSSENCTRAAKIYLEPLIIGPVFDQGKVPTLGYGEVQMLALQYDIDYAAAQALLPDFYPSHKRPARDVVVPAF